MKVNLVVQRKKVDQLRYVESDSIRRNDVLAINVFEKD